MLPELLLHLLVRLVRLLGSSCHLVEILHLLLNDERRGGALFSFSASRSNLWRRRGLVRHGHGRKGWQRSKGRNRGDKAGHFNHFTLPCLTLGLLVKLFDCHLVLSGVVPCRLLLVKHLMPSFFFRSLPRLVRVFLLLSFLGIGNVCLLPRKSLELGFLELRNLPLFASCCPANFSLHNCGALSPRSLLTNHRSASGCFPLAHQSSLIFLDLQFKGSIAPHFGDPFCLLLFPRR